MKLILAHNLVEMLDKVSIPLFLYGRAHLVSSLLAVPYSLRWVVLLNNKTGSLYFLGSMRISTALRSPYSLDRDYANSCPCFFTRTM